MKEGGREGGERGREGRREGGRDNGLTIITRFLSSFFRPVL